MTNLTVENIYAEINKAKPEDRLALAETLLDRYNGDDKELVIASIMEMAALESVEIIE